jgi:5-methylcytosine-specific restriction endonuclease McrA
MGIDPAFLHANSRARRRLGQRFYSRMRYELFQAQGGLCWWCKRPMRERTKLERRLNVNLDDHATVDHVLALSLGGTNDRANCVAACNKCNQERSEKERKMARVGRDEYHGFGGKH